MNATNPAAAVGGDTESDIKASTLNLGLDSIALLKKQGIFSAKNIVSPSSFLRTAAQDSDLNAMEKLGLQLLSGDSLPKVCAERQASTEFGNPFEMERLV